MEPSPDCGTHGRAQCGGCFVCSMVCVFREVWRVLRDDGTLWLNLGDTYGGHSRGGASNKQDSNVGSRGVRPASNPLKPGNLIGVPWRVALALQADGWILRSDIPWVKSSPMPDSCTNRPGKALEYVFMLAKSSDYYFDMEAVRPRATSSGGGAKFGKANVSDEVARAAGAGNSTIDMGVRPAYDKRGWRNSDLWFQSVSKPYGLVGIDDDMVGINCGGGNFNGAHFATFGSALIAPMILAGTSEHGCCSVCGSPWERILEKTNSALSKPDEDGRDRSFNWSRNGKTGSLTNMLPLRVTTGWRPVCVCGAPSGFSVDDFDIINSPTGDGAAEDDCLATGRAGLNRQRNGDEGRRPITRWEQRRYAEQIKVSTYRDDMEIEAGLETFTHYTRTDRSGAIPPRPDLLEVWIERGWLEEVCMPVWDTPPTIPCTVLDPFVGSGTTPATAVSLGRRGVGVDLSDVYLCDYAVPRCREAVGAAAKAAMERDGTAPSPDECADALPVDLVG